MLPFPPRSACPGPGTIVTAAFSCVISRIVCPYKICLPSSAAPCAVNVHVPSYGSDIVRVGYAPCACTVCVPYVALTLQLSSSYEGVTGIAVRAPLPASGNAMLTSMLPPAVPASSALSAGAAGLGTRPFSHETSSAAASNTAAVSTVACSLYNIEDICA